MSSAEPTPFFRRIVTVDGSASSRPVHGVDSIWVGTVDDGVQSAPVNLSTRHELREHLIDLACGPGRTLIAVDWSLGYPAGTAGSFGLDGADPHSAMWGHLRRSIIDAGDNANNRFDVAGALNRRTGTPGPFWGAPRSAANIWLTSTKQPFAVVEEWRLAEARVRSTSRWVSSCWQLGGAGAVGGQSLVGIALLAVLLDHLRPRQIAVWPFDTGLSAPSAEVELVVAEMWPSLFLTADDLITFNVRDAGQVERMAQLLHAADLDGRLERWWAPDVPADDLARVTGEEGWILGVP